MGIMSKYLNDNNNIMPVTDKLIDYIDNRGKFIDYNRHPYFDPYSTNLDSYPANDMSGYNRWMDENTQLKYKLTQCEKEIELLRSKSVAKRNVSAIIESITKESKKLIIKRRKK